MKRFFLILLLSLSPLRADLALVPSGSSSSLRLTHEESRPDEILQTSTDLLTWKNVEASENQEISPSSPPRYFRLRFPSSLVYSSQDYPDLPGTILSENQRYLGGPNASDTNDGTQSAPWSSFDKALREMSKAPSGGWYCLNIAADITVDQYIWSKYYGFGNGTLDRFMIIRGDPAAPDKPTLTLNARIDIDSQEHWLWYGFRLAGTEGINVGKDRPTTHHTFRNLEGKMPGEGGDNHGFLQALNSNADYFGVFNSRFEGPGTGSSVHGNTACVIAFGIPHLRWENNEVSNAPRPFYFKHGNRSVSGPAEIVIRNNFVSGVGICAFAGDAVGGSAQISNNIFQQPIVIENGGGGPQVAGYQIVHNTFGGTVSLGHSNDPVIDCVFKNNIFLADLEFLRYLEEGSNTNQSDYNLHAQSIWYRRQSYSPSTWNSSGVPSNQDAHSASGQPNFLAGSPPETIQGYEVQPGPGYQASETGKNLGADPAIVGVKP